uniref:Uncharacterized protein n=1 Tax=viral metagenome TaxID=1070528 RepID=A0A6C0E7N3_9ZZZZ
MATATLNTTPTEGGTNVTPTESSGVQVHHENTIDQSKKILDMIRYNWLKREISILKERVGQYQLTINVNMGVNPSTVNQFTHFKEIFEREIETYEKELQSYATLKTDTNPDLTKETIGTTPTEASCVQAHSGMDLSLSEKILMVKNKLDALRMDLAKKNDRYSWVNNMRIPGLKTRIDYYQEKLKTQEALKKQDTINTNDQEETSENKEHYSGYNPRIVENYTKGLESYTQELHAWEEELLSFNTHIFPQLIRDLEELNDEYDSLVSQSVSEMIQSNREHTSMSEDHTQTLDQYVENVPRPPNSTPTETDTDEDETF